MEGAIRIRTISAKTDAGFSISDMDSDGGKDRSMKIVDKSEDGDYQLKAVYLALLMSLR